MNKVFLAGRLASDPQQFVTQNGITQSRISVACVDNWNKNESYFFPCVAWQSTANFINTYLKKGDSVVIDGKLIRRSYVSKEGKTVYVVEVVIETIKPFGSKRTTNDNTIMQNSNASNKNNFTNSTPNFGEDEFNEYLEEMPLNNNDNMSSNQNINNNHDNNNEEVVDLDWMNDI